METKIIKRCFGLVSVLMVPVLMVFINIACTASKTLLFGHNENIWKMYDSGKGKVKLFNYGYLPKWIPGKKTHFAYLDLPPFSGGYFSLVVAAEDVGNRIFLIIDEIPGVSDAFSWSPDGKWIAFMSTDGNIYKVNVNSGKRVRLAVGRNPVWSPKGDKIAFIADREFGSYSPVIYIINDDGTGEKDLSKSIKNAEFPSWSPDGKKIVFVGQPSVYYSSIVTVDIASGKIETITSGKGTQHEYRQVHWGEQFIYYYKPGVEGSYSYSIEQYDTKTGKTNSVLEGFHPLFFSNFTSNAAYVFFAGFKVFLGIHRIQHYTGEIKVLGFGGSPDVW